MTEHQQGELKSVPTLLLDAIERLAVVETQQVQIIRGQDRAEDDRKIINEKLDNLSRAADTVSRLEPIVVNLDQIRLQQAGERGVKDWLARMIWAAIGTCIALAVELVHYFTSKH